MVASAIGKTAWRIALEDAFVVGISSFFGALIATGLVFPPPADVIYAAAIPAALVGVTSYAKARKV